MLCRPITSNSTKTVPQRCCKSFSLVLVSEYRFYWTFRHESFTKVFATPAHPLVISPPTMSCWKANYFTFFKVSDGNRRSHNYFMVIKVSHSAPVCLFFMFAKLCKQTIGKQALFLTVGSRSVIYLMNIVGNCFDSNWHRSKFHLCVGIAERREWCARSVESKRFPQWNSIKCKWDAFEIQFSSEKIEKS